MKIEIRRSRRRRRQFYVRIIGANGEVLLHSENYQDKRDALHLVDLVLGMADAVVPVEDLT